MNKKQLTHYNFLKSEIRFRIWGLLSIYSELSFTNLCKKLYKSKSTVHPHLQKLIEIGIVEVVREEKVRGNIPAKIYSLTDRGLNQSIFTGVRDIEKVDKINPENFESILSSLKLFDIHIRNFINMKLKFYEKLENREDSLTILNQMKEEGELFGSMIFLSKSQYSKFKKFYNEILFKMNEIIKEDKINEKQINKPYFFIASGININKIIEHLL
ncbi:MAG: winged helix-turn-helix domain-containing protein [Promethearchaeota archaeon]